MLNQLNKSAQAMIGGWQVPFVPELFFPPDIEAQAHNTAPLVTNGVHLTTRVPESSNCEGSGFSPAPPKLFLDVKKHLKSRFRYVIS